VGRVTEDNSFGTHEFLDLCEQLGAEPYITGNVGSGTVQDFAQWVQYVNFDGVSPMSASGRERAREALERSVLGSKRSLGMRWKHDR